MGSYFHGSFLFRCCAFRIDIDSASFHVGFNAEAVKGRRYISHVRVDIGLVPLTVQSDSDAAVAFDIIC